MTSLRRVFQDRLDQFQADYTFDEQDEVVRSLAVAGELLELTFGELEASLAMTAIREMISGDRPSEWDWSRLNAVPVDYDWRTTWSEIDGWSESSEPVFLDELHDLNAFANFGIFTVWQFAGDEALDLPVGDNIRVRLSTIKNAPDWVERVCAKIDQLERLAPKNESGGTYLNEILTTRNRARARIKFDLKQPLTIHELASLSGVTVKRIQNAVYAKTDEAPVVDRNGLISPEACEPWLTTRDYWPSIWHQVSALYPLAPGWGEDVEVETTELPRFVEDYVFVPVANDGSIFAPYLRRDGKSQDGGYTIGAKGAEESVATYDDALEKLKKMETPRWRRPNAESGNWGIVTGQTWKRIRRSELEVLSL